MLITGPKRCLIAVCAVLALAAAACGGDDSDDDGGAAPATTAAPAATEAPDDEPAATTAAPTTAAPETEAPAEPAEDSKPPIKMAVINQEDGLYAWPEVSENTRIFVDWINANGGIDGHMLEMDLCTSGDDPESAQACAQRFANDDSAEFVYIATVLNSAPVYEVLGPDGANKPMIGQMLWDVPDSLQPGLYSTDPGLLPLAYEVIRFAVEDDGATNLAVLVDDSDIGEATLAVVEYFLSTLGGTTFTPVKINMGQADFLPAMTRANVGQSDGLVLLIGESAACQPTRDAMEALGVGDVPAYMGDWCVGEEFRTSGTAEGWRMVTGGRGTLTNDPQAQMVRDIYEAAGAEPPLGLAFAATMNMDFFRQVMELAVEQAGGVPTGAQVAAAAEEWSGSILLGPDTMDCPGVGIWASTCNSAAIVISLQDGEWVALEDFQLIDVSLFDPLLG